MRPLGSHWKLPEGCFWCCCRPFSVGELDGPYIEFVSLLFREIQALFFQVDLVLVYRFNLLLASLGPPASCCGDPGLDAGLFSGFASSRGVISISNFQGMQQDGSQTRIVSSFGFTAS